jgi:hypothetical protein
MHHPGPVDGGERGRHAHRECLHVGAGQRPVLAQHTAEVGSGDVLGDDPQRVAVQLRVEHRCGAEPPHAARRRHLTLEPHPELRVIREMRIDHFDRDRARGPLGEVDRAHAALSQLAGDAVGAESHGIGRAQREDRMQSIGRHSRRS